MANQYGQQRQVKQGEAKVPITKPTVKAFEKRSSSKDAKDVAALPDNVVVKQQSKLPSVTDLID